MKDTRLIGPVITALWVAAREIMGHRVGCAAVVAGCPLSSLAPCG